MVSGVLVILTDSSVLLAWLIPALHRLTTMSHLWLC